MNLPGGSEYRVYNLTAYCTLRTLTLEYANRAIVDYGNTMFISINFEPVKRWGDQNNQPKSTIANKSSLTCKYVNDMCIFKIKDYVKDMCILMRSPKISWVFFAFVGMHVHFV